MFYLLHGEDRRSKGKKDRNSFRFVLVQIQIRKKGERKKEKEKDREDQEIFISLTTFWQKGNGLHHHRVVGLTR
jgi:hypothetical protein